MKINASALTLAVTLIALWALRRIGMDATTADAITSALLVGLGLSRPAVDSAPAVEAPKAEAAEPAKVIKVPSADAHSDAPKPADAPAQVEGEKAPS